MKLKWLFVLGILILIGLIVVVKIFFFFLCLKAHFIIEAVSSLNLILFIVILSSWVTLLRFTPWFYQGILVLVDIYQTVIVWRK